MLVVTHQARPATPDTVHHRNGCIGVDAKRPGWRPMGILPPFLLRLNRPGFDCKPPEPTQGKPLPVQKQKS